MATSDLVLTEAYRKIRELNESLNNARSAAGTILAAVALASSFLGAQAFNLVDRHAFPTGVEGVLIAGVIACTVLTVVPLGLAASVLGPTDAGTDTNIGILAGPEWLHINEGDAAVVLAMKMDERTLANVETVNTRWSRTRWAGHGAVAIFVAWAVVIVVALITKQPQPTLGGSS